MQLFKQINRKLKWTIIIAGVVFALIASYAVISLLIWRAYDQKIARADSTWQANQQQLNGPLISDQKEWSVKYATLKPSIDDLAQLHCQVTPLIVWQANLITSLDDDQQHCQEIKDKSQQVSQQLDVINRYVDDIVTVNDVLRPLAGLPSTQQQSDWVSTAKAWKSAADKLENIETSDSFGDYTDKLAKSTAKVAQAWQKLLDSDKAKNAQDFESAKQDLDSAYQKFSKQAENYPHNQDNIFDI